MKQIILGILFSFIVAGLVYGFVANGYVEEIRKVDAKIEAKNSELIDIWYSKPTRSPPPIVEIPKEDFVTDTKLCLTCHEKRLLYSFHVPEKIRDLEMKKGRPIKLCTTCHGEPVMPVHFKAIQKKLVTCEACHIRGSGPFMVPLKRNEDLLICQLCHAGGNYIDIHIDGDILKNAEIDLKWIRSRRGFNCTVCHNEGLYGGKDILMVHKENAGNSGRIDAEIDIETLPMQVFDIPKRPSSIKKDKEVIDWQGKVSGPTSSIVIP